MFRLSLRLAPSDRGAGNRHGTDRRNHRPGSREREAVTRHTLPRDFGMHRVDMAWQIVLGESDTPASGVSVSYSNAKSMSAP